MLFTGSGRLILELEPLYTRMSAISVGSGPMRKYSIEGLMNIRQKSEDGLL